MAAQHDTTEIRTKLAGAINRVVAMADHETDDVVDAVMDALRPGNGAEAPDDELARTVNVLETLENADCDLDTILGTLQMATQAMEESDKVRPLYLIAEGIESIRESILSLQSSMIRAKGRGEAWDIPSAATS